MFLSISAAKIHLSTIIYQYANIYFIIINSKINMDSSESQTLIEMNRLSQESQMEKKYRFWGIQIVNVEHRQSHSSLRSLIVWSTLLLSIIIVFFYASTYKFYASPYKKQNQHNISGGVLTRLPKIVWIYTYNQWEGQKPENIINLHYLNHTSRNNWYDVRIVNSWNAYDWLSPNLIENITKTIQNKKIDEMVSNLLKLALLIEHGGIMIGDLNFILSQGNFYWLQKMFQKGGDASMFAISPDEAQVYVPLNPNKQSEDYFKHEIIASVPQSFFIRQSFQTLQKAITQQILPNNQTLQFFKYNNYLNILYLYNSIAKVMTSIVYDANSSGIVSNNMLNYYKIQKPNKQIIVNIDDISNNQKMLNKMIAKDNYTSFVFDSQFFVKKNIKKIMFKNSKRMCNINSFLYSVMQAPQNYQVFCQIKNQRKPHLCLIIVDDFEKQDSIMNEIDPLRFQTNFDWNVVTFSKIQKEVQKRKGMITIVPSSGNKLRNIEIAVTQHCDIKSYAIILKAGDKFNSNNALSVIAQALKDPEVVGASISLMINKTFHSVLDSYLHFSKQKDFIRNQNYQKMNGILNHMRIFSVEAFRYIPQMEWRDTYGVYFQDRTIAVSTILELIQKSRHQKSEDELVYEQYTKRKYAKLFNFPSKAIKIDSSVIISTNEYQQVNRNMMRRIEHRYDVQPISKSIRNCYIEHIPFRKMLVFNKGSQFVPIDKKTGPQLIPKIIHQVWVGGQLPLSKKYFIQKIKRMLPHYQMVIWGQVNITRQNFPVCYDLIQNLLSYQKSGKSPYSKYATITDLMRHELMYYSGGFWRDAGFNLFKPVLDQFVRYKLVIGAQMTIRSRWNQGMCFFGNQPRNQNMLRVSSYQNVNRMHIYSTIALSIAGPIDFRQVVNQFQQQNPEILIMQFQYFYPAQQDHFLPDFCTKKKEQVKEGEQFVFESKGYVMLPPDCQSKYPIAFGNDHNAFGVSWVSPQYSTP